jgi:HlyD family secretion protein
MSRAIIWGGVLLGVLATLSFHWPSDKQEQVPTLRGVVEMPEVRLSSRVGGRVVRVIVAEGDRVESGQTLAVFDVPELQAQRAQQQARLRAAEADLERAKSGPQREEIRAAAAVVDSARARWQRLKAGTRPEEIEQARSDWETAQIDGRLAEADLGRAEGLYLKGALSRADLESARAAQDRTWARVRAASARLKLVQAGCRPEEIAEALAELNQAQARHDLLTHGTRPEEIAKLGALVAECQARLTELDAQLREAVVTAPEAGVVEALLVRPGEVVAANQPVIRVRRSGG